MQNNDLKLFNVMRSTFDEINPESRAASCRGSQMLKCVSANILEQFSEKITENESPGMHPVVIGLCSFVMAKKKSKTNDDVWLLCSVKGIR